MQLKSEFKIFGLFLLTAGGIVLLFVFLHTLTLMQKEIMRTTNTQEALMQKMLVSPTVEQATPSATQPPSRVLRTFRFLSPLPTK